jgi:hypothetical protein
MTGPRWYRVVDAHNQGWHPTGTLEGGTVISADYGFKRGLPDYPTYEALAAARGPLRPVQPITAADRDELRRLIAYAGRQAITSLAAAVEVVWNELIERSKADTLDAYHRAKTWLLAGREGSWESEALIAVALFGNTLNLAKETRDRWRVPDRRAAGPVRRVNKEVRDQMAAMILRWVTDPARFTEVAETLAAVVSAYADEIHGPDGWRMIADQWLQPGGLAAEDTRNCYRLFYSLSEHLDTRYV